MIFINLITMCCLSLMIVGVLTVVNNLLSKSREERINYIRGFKKGQGVLIYVFAIPLLWLGIYYSGETVFVSFFYAIKRAVELIVLKYDLSSVRALVDANPLYSFAVFFCFVLVGLNTVMFALSLGIQRIWNFYTNYKFKVAKKGKLIILGNTPENHLIYESEKNRAKIIVDKIDKTEGANLYLKNISYTDIKSFSEYVSEIVGCIDGKNECVVVVNTGSDEKNLEIGRYFTEKIQPVDVDAKSPFYGRLKVFLFGDPQFEAVYEDIVKRGLGCINYVNKYQKIAMDFIDKYPLTKFMNGDQIDYSTSCIKKGVSINVLMLGFGKTNQQIFLTSVANNQFIKMGRNGVELKKVRYHIFDKHHAENNKNLNHNYYRYKNECSNVNKSDYLPLPSYPADESYHHLDINDVNFYNEIRRITKRSKKSVNFVIIAFGTDLENVDMARKLIIKSKEWGICNLTIFVKVRKDSGNYLVDEPNCYVIANENTSVYDINAIVGDNIFKMAMMRNQVYEIENELVKSGSDKLDEGKIDAVKSDADYYWYVSLVQHERDSNLYGCLSLKMKLNLMGLDYCDKVSAGDEALTEDEYMRIYAKDDMPNTEYYNLNADGKHVIRYTLDFADSRRRNMAIHEHMRWNSYMISKGFIPADKSLIKGEKVLKKGKLAFSNGKNYALRRHGNLTTFNGLVEFRKMVAKRDGVSEEDKDVIKYDYQLLDDAYWLLAKSGQAIIKKK